MLTRKMIVGMVVSALFYAGITSGTTYYVSTDGSDDANGLSWETAFATIQKGIYSCIDGDTVIVADGNYTGTSNRNITFQGKEITVKSVNGPNNCVINCEGSRDSTRCGFIFQSGESQSSVLDGFTIINGYGNYIAFDDMYAGGAIICNGSKPTIRRCILKNNMNDKTNSDTYGGAIACYSISGSGLNPIIENCEIYDNEAYYGGGISVISTSPTIRNCMIFSNSANKGGGVDIRWNSSADINNCTIVDNSADTDGDGIYCRYSTESIMNCILWGNGNDLYDCIATYSCVEDGDSGTGNISSYPYFADYDGNDFHLTWNSPCINSGEPDVNHSGETDIDGEERVVDGRVDMGADELNIHNINLLTNPGFEDGFDDWEYFSNPPGTGTFTIEDCNCYEGNHCLKMEHGESTVQGMKNTVGNLIPGEYYLFTAMFKTTLNHIGYINLYDSSWKDSNGNYVGKSFSIQLYGNNEWLKIRNNVHIPLVDDYGQSTASHIWRVIVYGHSPATNPDPVYYDSVHLSLSSPVIEFLPPYGWINEPNLAKSIDFGAANDDDPNYYGGIVWNSSSMGGRFTDTNDENITYRELKAGETLVIEVPKFNLDPNYDPNDMNSLPLTPMLLEIMFNDATTGSIYLYSKLDYINLDPNYLISSSRDYYLANFGGVKDYKWKYMQYGFQKSHYQLLRAINGKFTIKITNYSNANIPVDYISLRKISDDEYESLVNKQKEKNNFYEAELPPDAPSEPNYSDPNLTVFVRDIMRPVYKHTKPGPNEPNSVTAFSCWGEVEPLSFSIYSENGANDITVEVSNLAHIDGNTIDGNEISIYQVICDDARLRYVHGNVYSKSYAMVPDHLEMFDTLSVDANSSESILLKVQVPEEDENLPAGLYKGQITISRPNEPNIYIPIDFTVYDIVLDKPAHLSPVYFDPYDRSIYSSDLNVVFKAYTETGFDAFMFMETHRITVTGNINNIIFDSNNFEEALERMIEEGFVKDKAFIHMYIDAELLKIYEIVFGSPFSNSNPDLYAKLSDPIFAEKYGSMIEKYIDIADAHGVTLVFQVSDEPGANPYRRILSDRLYTIIKNPNYVSSNYEVQTTATYDTSCDNPCSPVCYDDAKKIYYSPCPEGGSYNVGTEDGNIPPLTNWVDFKVWSMTHQYDGYKRHYDPDDPDYYGEGNGGYFGYYTTYHSQLRNPVYNRFLHGLFAFGTDSKVASAYAMGDYVIDPYNDFDTSSPDYLYAYPTWSGELLYTIGGLEAIREGIKDGRYIATLEKLISENPSNCVAQAAQEYLNELAGRIDPNYPGAYISKDTEDDLGYYWAILRDVNGTDDANDFEAFTRIRKDIAEYIVLLSSLASEPSPADGAEDVNTDTSMSWQPGKCALSYDVYLGTDYNDVNDATPDSNEYMGSVDVNSYDPNSLEYETTYYWRIDSNSVVGIAKGNVWSFTSVAPPEVSIIGSWVTGTSHTKESGTNRALVFIAHAEDNDYPAINLTSASYGGQAMTKVVEEVVSTGWWWYQTRAYVVAYILDEEGIDNATGNSFSVSWNQTPDYVAYSSVFLENINQTVLTGASASNKSTSGATIVTSAMTTDDGDMVIDAATCGNAGSYTFNNGFTEGTDQTMNNTATGATGYKSATGANETPSATFSGDMNRQVITGFVVQSSE